LALAGCSQVIVTTDHDPSANFGALHSYAWRPGPQQGLDDPRFDSTLIDKRVRSAVDRVLASKGYRTAAPGSSADFLVGYHAVMRQKTSVQTINRSYGYRVGGWRGPQTYVQDYEEGTLLIDVIDPATMDLLWRGTGTGVVDPLASPEKREQRINDAVERILADFPPPQ
jgi:hypothetical protein